MQPKIAVHMLFNAVEVRFVTNFPFIPQICGYAPDLARTIAGLIVSSNDSHFQGECISLLGLHGQNIASGTIEDCVKEKIMAIIETNDRKTQKSKETAPYLFEDDCLQEPYIQDEEYEGEDGDDFLVLD